MIGPFTWRAVLRRLRTTNTVEGNWRRTFAAALTTLVVIAACNEQAPGPWNQETGYRWRTLAVRGDDPGFTALSSRRTGIDFRNTVSDSLLQRNRVLGQGAGVAIGDIDGDGLLDIFFARTEGCNALYRNTGGWKFQEIAERAGVAACDRFSTGAAFVDVDGRNGLDLILLATRGPNAVFVNDGRGTFTERRDLGLDSIGKGGTTVAMADTDGDGDLDLYVANYNPYNVDDSLPPQQRQFSRMVRQTGPNQYEIVPEHRPHYRLVMRPDMGGLRMSQRGAADDFYVNDTGRFRRATFSERFRGSRGEIAEEQESFTLAARFADLNGDRAPDLFVANDFEDLDELWYNDGRGNFRRADWMALRQMSNSAMGVDVGDVDGDALPDIFEVDMLAHDAERLKTQMPTHTAFPKLPGDLQSQLQQQRNALFLNRGDGTFAEAGLAAGVHASGWSWSTMMMDVDLDGWQDILITNGHLWDIMDADTHERLQSGLGRVSWQRLRWEFPPLKLRNVAYRNVGSGRFEDASETWGFGVEEDISHAMAAGDLDGDGDSDVVVSRLDAPALILRNDATAPRVAVRLVGDAPNTAAVGAKVRLIAERLPLQEREITAGGLYMSHSDHQVAFAMGTADTARIIVEWRDGRKSEISGVRADRLYEISQAGAAAFAVASAEDSAAHAGRATPLFEDVSRSLAHRHVDPSHDDWLRQFLPPNSLSQLGPGIAWFDYDGDGDEDLLIGSGRGGRVTLARNERGRLTTLANAGPRAEYDITTILGLNTASGASILFGIATWEAASTGATTSVPPVIAATVAERTLGNPRAIAGAVSSSTGPLAAADYDGDGDLDIFVGGRAIPGAYPRAASSQLLRNERGSYVADTSHAALLRGVGLVSGAVFSDMDGDGDADLLLAREWDSLLFLINDNGTFTAAPASYGLDRWTSRWNGIATGDLDGDGRMDIVATSWGRNTMMQADSARPLVMLHGPFGTGGGEELLIAQHDARRDGLIPANGFARVRATIPDLSDRLRTFRDYANASVEQVLGPAMAQVQRKEVRTLDHMVFLNRGRRFDAAPLPHEAQLAPAFYVGIADFDGDGAEDVFLAQNFSATAVGLPRYDSGRGLILTGDGTGALRPMSGPASGLLVYGDQRGAAYGDFDGDARLDLAVSQNAAETRLFRNQGAQPGIRVRVMGPPSNSAAIGAQVRVMYGTRMGAAREIQAGSGYWSQNGAVQVFSRASTPTAVRVRWPGGEETVTPVPAGATEIIVRR